MPLPWKKAKTNRISRIVADLQPPTRGASLVVETGFPTSVIDLFVKNRDRIKRQSYKKNKRTKHFPPPDISDSVAPPPTPSRSPDSDSPPIPLANCSGGPSRVTEFDHHHHHLESPARGTADADSKPTGSTVFVLAVKMFLVAVPAMSNAKVAIGIALSAFLLLLLEILGKYFAVGFTFTNPYWIWKRLFLESETVTAAECRRDGLIIDRKRREEPPRNSGSDEIIQIVEESNSDHECEGLQRDPFIMSREMKLGYLYEEGEIEVAKSERSRRAKLKAKINKLIPKKLRSGKRVKSKNKKNNKTQPACSEFPGLGLPDQEQENEHGSASSCEEEDEDHEVYWAEEHRPEEEEEEEEEEEDKEEIHRKQSQCVFVLVTILLGLLGSRFLALVLTVSGCFMFKFIKILHQKWKFG